MKIIFFKISQLQIMLIAFSVLMTACVKTNEETETVFSEITASNSSILFKNTITESDSLNYFKFPYMYMGAGVSIVDINNDGLSDVFLTGNMVPNKLYLNKGNFQFDDITEKAGISGDDRWYTGTTIT